MTGKDSAAPVVPPTNQPGGEGDEMNLREVRPGLRVRTVNLGGTQGMGVAPKLLALRRAFAVGKVLNYVPGLGGDVWWVEHEDGTVAPYCFTEFEAAGVGPGGN